MDMVDAPEIVHYIMDKISSYWCDYIKFALDAAGDKIDIVYTYDDIASRNSLIMSPEMLEEFVYPYHRKVNAVIKSYGKNGGYIMTGTHFMQNDTPVENIIAMYDVSLR